MLFLSGLQSKAGRKTGRNWSQIPLIVYLPLKPLVQETVCSFARRIFIVHQSNARTIVTCVSDICHPQGGPSQPDCALAFNNATSNNETRSRSSCPQETIVLQPVPGPRQFASGNGSEPARMCGPAIWRESECLHRRAGNHVRKVFLSGPPAERAGATSIAVRHRSCGRRRARPTEQD